jgi:hypothetical protein
MLPADAFQLRQFEAGGGLFDGDQPRQIPAIGPGVDYRCWALCQLKVVAVGEELRAMRPDPCANGGAFIDMTGGNDTRRNPLEVRRKVAARSLSRSSAGAGGITWTGHPGRG